MHSDPRSEAATGDTVAAFAPAKINLSLHVTGRRPDGYHLLDSFVVFADVGDTLTVALDAAPGLSVTGPMAPGVPTGPGNLVLKAAAFFGASARITLDKHLPAEAGIGGGSSDAAAVLRALSGLTSQPVPEGTQALGADVPVCVLARAARMRGLGEIVDALPPLPPLHAVLANPGVAVATPAVFAALDRRDTPPMPECIPHFAGTAALIDWLTGLRNDLERPALTVAPVIADVIAALQDLPGCALARMSGSGATCFGLFTSRDAADAGAARLSALRPDWWVRAATLT